MPETPEQRLEHWSNTFQGLGLEPLFHRDPPMIVMLPTSQDRQALGQMYMLLASKMYAYGQRMVAEAAETMLAQTPAPPEVQTGPAAPIPGAAYPAPSAPAAPPPTAGYPPPYAPVAPAPVAPVYEPAPAPPYAPPAPAVTRPPANPAAAPIIPRTPAPLMRPLAPGPPPAMRQAAPQQPPGPGFA